MLFSLLAVFIYSSVLAFDGTIYLVLGLGLIIKRDLHHKRDQRSGPFPTLFL